MPPTTPTKIIAQLATRYRKTPFNCPTCAIDAFLSVPDDARSAPVFFCMMCGWHSPASESLSTPKPPWMPTAPEPAQ